MTNYDKVVHADILVSENLRGLGFRMLVVYVSWNTSESRYTRKLRLLYISFRCSRTPAGVSARDHIAMTRSS